MNTGAYSFLAELGRKISEISGDDREGSFLFQRLSVLIQRSYNAIMLHESFSQENRPDQWLIVLIVVFFHNFFFCRKPSAEGRQNNSNNNWSLLEVQAHLVVNWRTFSSAQCKLTLPRRLRRSGYYIPVAYYTVTIYLRRSKRQRRLCFGSEIFLSAGLHKKIQLILWNLRKGWRWHNEEIITFWWRFGFFCELKIVIATNRRWQLY